MSSTAAPRMLAVAALSAVAIAGAAVLWQFDPSAPGNFFPPCLFHALTGLQCPGCGLTRMLHALVHGDIRRAASMNLMVLASLPALGAISLNEATHRRLLSSRVTRVLYNAKLWITVVLVFGVLRNLPWAPFLYLAPG